MLHPRKVRTQTCPRDPPSSLHSRSVLSAARSCTWILWRHGRRWTSPSSSQGGSALHSPVSIAEEEVRADLFVFRRSWIVSCLLRKCVRRGRGGRSLEYEADAPSSQVGTAVVRLVPHATPIPDPLVLCVHRGLELQGMRASRTRRTLRHPRAPSGQFGMAVLLQVTIAFRSARASCGSWALYVKECVRRGPSLGCVSSSIVLANRPLLRPRSRLCTNRYQLHDLRMLGSANFCFCEPELRHQH